MSKRPPFLLAATLFLTFAAGHTQAGPKSLLEFEKRGIDRIAQFTAKERSTILFEVGGYEEHAVGYAMDGRIEWIDSSPISSECRRHPALSHDGLKVAFMSNGRALAPEPTRPFLPIQYCRINIYDIPTAAERELVQVLGDPGEISWSWDGTEIAFYERGISAVSVRDGVRKVLLPMNAFDGGRMQWYPMQWLHNQDLVIELSKEIPVNKSGTSFVDQSSLFVVSRGALRLLAIGRSPAVSPLSDRIAYYASGRVVEVNGRVAAINADGTGRALLARAPRALPLFAHQFFGDIVWSPDGSRLFFGEMVSDTLSDDLHLLDVKSGRYEHFFSGTSIQIRGWH
jgi:hypothetical protein